MKSIDQSRPTNYSPKDESIQTLRAVAIILVVFFHISGDRILGDARNAYDIINYFVQNIRLPLFTIISGYLYAGRSVIAGKLAKFFAGKARRILIPLFVVSTLEFLATTYAPGVNQRAQIGEIWRIYFFAYEHFWFLQAIFLIFIIVAILDSTKALDSFLAWFITLALSLGLLFVSGLIPREFDFFSALGMTFLLPFFLLGIGLKRFYEVLQCRRALFASSAIALALVALQVLALNAGMQEMFAKRSYLGTATGLAIGMALFNLKPRNAVLAYIGAYAYTIYLFQSFGAAIGRRVFDSLASPAPHIYVAGTLIFTVAFGILVEEVAKSNSPLRIGLLGLKAKSNKNKRG